MVLPFLFIKKTETMGRGVFTDSQIKADEVVEISPVIIMSNDDKVHIDKTLLHDYIFTWISDKNECCMALGYIPIYNHSYKSNCDYFMDEDTQTIMIKTVREIDKNEELTINYNGDWDDETKVWFDKNE